MSTNVSSLLNIAFCEARRLNLERQKDWVSVSHMLGGKLPRSLLSVSIQRCGTIDAIVCAIESDVLATLKKIYDDNLFILDIQLMFSEIWVSEIYEIIRLIKERKLTAMSVEAEDLFWKVTMLRMAFDKHEIAEDRLLKNDVTFYSDGELSSPFVYSRKDRLRSHIMRKGPSSRGSICWDAFDSNTKQSIWIERRALSDDFLSIFCLNKKASTT